MIDQATSRFQGLHKPHLTAALLLAMLTLGALFTGWMVVRADREMRTDLLQRLRVAVQAVNVEQIQALTGTPAASSQAEKPCSVASSAGAWLSTRILSWMV